MQDMSTYKTRNAYLTFKRTHKEINIAEREFYQIVCEFNRSFVRNMMTKRNGLMLPENVMRIAVCTFKNKAKLVDFGRTKKEGKICYFDNKDTDGLAFKIMGRTTNNNSLLYPAWRIVPCREVTRCYVDLMKKNFKKYKSIIEFLGLKNTIDAKDFRLKYVSIDDF